MLLNWLKQTFEPGPNILYVFPTGISSAMSCKTHSNNSVLSELKLTYFKIVKYEVKTQHAELAVSHLVLSTPVSNLCLASQDTFSIGKYKWSIMFEVIPNSAIHLSGSLTQCQSNLKDFLMLHTHISA